MAGYTYDQILALTRQAGYQGQQATGIATTLYKNQTASVTQASQQSDPLGSYLGQQFARGAKLGLGLLAGGIALFALLAGPAIAGGQKASQLVGPAAGVESIRASRATRALRTRQLQNLNTPPQGGAPSGDGTPSAPRSTRGQLMSQPYSYGRNFGRQRGAATPRAPQEPLTPGARRWVTYNRARGAYNRGREGVTQEKIEGLRQQWLAVATDEEKQEHSEHAGASAPPLRRARVLTDEEERTLQYNKEQKEFLERNRGKSQEELLQGVRLSSEEIDTLRTERERLRGTLSSARTDKERGKIQDEIDKINQQITRAK